MQVSIQMDSCAPEKTTPPGRGVAPRESREIVRAGSSTEVFSGCHDSEPRYVRIALRTRGVAQRDFDFVPANR